MHKANTPSSARKRKKPYREFPLFPHATGRWCKKIRGKFCYFGKIDNDPRGDAALAQFLEQRDRLYAGLDPVPDSPDIRLLLNRYLNHQRIKLEDGELSQRSFDLNRKTCDRIKDVVGLMTSLASIDSVVCDNLRQSINGGVVTRKNEIQRIRAVFKFAYDAALVDRPIRYYTLKMPSETALRKHRCQRPRKEYSPQEIRSLLNAAGGQLKSMVLLGANCGLGNTDCAYLTFDAVDLPGAWLDFARTKNGMTRRAKLWPETVHAIHEAIETRKEPKNEDHKDIIFITKYGGPWLRPGRQDNAISPAFRKLLEATGCHRQGRGFASLRHTFRTIADETKDIHAVDLIMGHAPVDTGRRYYLERISDARLTAVADFVRFKVFPDKAGAQ